MPFRDVTDADELLLVGVLRKGRAPDDPQTWEHLADMSRQRQGDAALTPKQWRGYYLLNRDRVDALVSLPPRRGSVKPMPTESSADDEFTAAFDPESVSVFDHNISVDDKIGLDPQLHDSNTSATGLMTAAEYKDYKKSRKQRVEFSGTEDHVIARYLSRFPRADRDTSSHFKALCAENPGIRQLPDSCRRYYNRPSNRERLDELADKYRSRSRGERISSADPTEYVNQLANGASPNHSPSQDHHQNHHPEDHHRILDYSTNSPNSLVGNPSNRHSDIVVSSNVDPNLENPANQFVIDDSYPPTSSPHRSHRSHHQPNQGTHNDDVSTVEGIREFVEMGDATTSTPPPQPQTTGVNSTANSTTAPDQTNTSSGNNTTSNAANSNATTTTTTSTKTNDHAAALGITEDLSVGGDHTDWSKTSPSAASGDRMKQGLDHICGNYHLEYDQALVLWYACSGDLPVCDKVARTKGVVDHRKLVGLPPDSAAVNKKIWSESEDQLIRTRDKNIYHEIDQRRGKNSANKRFKFLEGEGRGYTLSADRWPNVTTM